MANFNLGQMRRNQYSSYSTPLKYQLDTFINNSSNIATFSDPCMNLTGSNIVTPSNSYYLKFDVTQLVDSIQNFVIKLQNKENPTENIQNVRTFTVKQGTEKVIFELIFNPNLTYDQIVFELKRSSEDYSENDRQMKVNVLAFDKVNNIITDYLQNKYTNLKSLKKIGIQGPPGLMFTINGEEIKIGKSGIYELYNENINISYLGFIIKDSSFTQNGKDYFIMDFKY